MMHSKKSNTERWVGQGDLRVNDEPIGRHQYSTLMVALSVAFYTRLSVGSRQVVEIFNILNEFTGGMFGKVPAYTSIGYWAQELVTELLQYSSLACFMPILQLCANLLIPNCLRSNLSYSPLAALELYVKKTIKKNYSQFFFCTIKKKRYLCTRFRINYV